MAKGDTSNTTDENDPAYNIPPVVVVVVVVVVGKWLLCARWYPQSETVTSSDIKRSFLKFTSPKTNMEGPKMTSYLKADTF